MAEDFQTELQELGLLPAEAQVYLALARNGALRGSSIATVTGFPRSSVYLTLNSLIDKGLIEGGAGNGSRFSVVPPEQALPSLVAYERELIIQRESLASRLGERIAALAEPTETAPEELVQVIRSPRAVAERFDRLQLEAKQQIDVFTKPPYFARAGNPVEEKALKRGVKVRSLYEKAALEDPAVKAYFATWIAAGEEARIFDGELPHKLAIFDSQAALVPLILPGEQMRALLIRHPQVAQSLSLAFQFVWDRAEPVALKSRNATAARRTGSQSRQGKTIAGGNSHKQST